MRKIAILQSNYLPWKGVFDMINKVDVFVFLEDVQYTKGDWRNRNKIITDKGLEWITVPVNKGDGHEALISEVQIDNSVKWQKKHYNTITYNYSKSPYFSEFNWLLKDIYLQKEWSSLSELNIYTTKLISNILGIKTEFVNSIDLCTKGNKDDKSIEICQKLNGTHYLSGPAAMSYIIPDKFNKADIELEYMRYDYPQYKQLREPFYNNVTILDLLFNCGNKSTDYIWAKKESL